MNQDQTSPESVREGKRPVSKSNSLSIPAINQSGDQGSHERRAVLGIPSETRDPFGNLPFVPGERSLPALTLDQASNSDASTFLTASPARENGDYPGAPNGSLGLPYRGRNLINQASYGNLLHAAAETGESMLAGLRASSSPEYAHAASSSNAQTPAVVNLNFNVYLHPDQLPPGTLTTGPDANFPGPYAQAHDTRWRQRSPNLNARQFSTQYSNRLEVTVQRYVPQSWGQSQDPHHGRNQESSNPEPKKKRPKWNERRIALRRERSEAYKESKRIETSNQVALLPATSKPTKAGKIAFDVSHTGDGKFGQAPGVDLDPTILEDHILEDHILGEMELYGSPPPFDLQDRVTFGILDKPGKKGPRNVLPRKSRTMPSARPVFPHDSVEAPPLKLDVDDIGRNLENVETTLEKLKRKRRSGGLERERLDLLYLEDDLLESVSFPKFVLPLVLEGKFSWSGNEQ
ncbi:hypothetical protein K402DRAFT_400256 [Aulographum hederae CBS 113979]|uniref:Uncharacterized protein n=1 Tax=Aulographum hederae CBS 113979 TaxID=1176131 RepID=A0A6G1HEC7_9PEZI|nr:hypothetical protein K402DRAFT_400256 [Aulographum hederae CBS 113979]